MQRTEIVDEGPVDLDKDEREPGEVANDEYPVTSSERVRARGRLSGAVDLAVGRISRPEFEVVGTADTASEALHQPRHGPIDVVFMDINLPGSSGVEATRQIAKEFPTTAVLMITMVDDDDSVFAALAAGARGYLLKGSTADEIAAAVRTVASGGAIFGAGVANRLLAGTPNHRPTEPSPVAPDLTPRERDVLDRLAAGANNQRIATALSLSVKTVQNHVSHILDCEPAQTRARSPSPTGEGRSTGRLPVP